MLTGVALAGVLLAFAFLRCDSALSQRTRQSGSQMQPAMAVPTQALLEAGERICLTLTAAAGFDGALLQASTTSRNELGARESSACVVADIVPSLTGDAGVGADSARVTDIFGGHAVFRTAARNIRLDGSLLGNTHRDHAFVGPALAGAMCGAQFQTWLNALWQWNRETPAYGYYGNELQLIPMIVASGNWWNP